VEQTIIPQLQLDAREQPLLINPERIWWKAHQIAPAPEWDPRHQSLVKNPPFKEALEMTAWELVQAVAKLASVDKKSIAYVIKEVPGVKDLYKVQIDYASSSVLAPKVISDLDPRCISDDFIMWCRDMLRLAKQVGELKLPANTNEELDKAIRTECLAAYKKKVFRGYTEESFKDQYELDEWGGVDWKQPCFLRKADGKQAIPFRSTKHGGIIHTKPDLYEIEPPIINHYNGHLNNAWVEWYKEFTGYSHAEALGQAYLVIREFREQLQTDCLSLEKQLGLPPETTQQ